jgi:hypothetical protein
MHKKTQNRQNVQYQPTDSSLYKENGTPQKRDKRKGPTRSYWTFLRHYTRDCQTLQYYPHPTLTQKILPIQPDGLVQLLPCLFGTTAHPNRQDLRPTSLKQNLQPEILNLGILCEHSKGISREMQTLPSIYSSVSILSYDCALFSNNDPVSLNCMSKLFVLEGRIA